MSLPEIPEWLVRLGEYGGCIYLVDRGITLLNGWYQGYKLQKMLAQLPPPPPNMPVASYDVVSRYPYTVNSRVPALVCDVEGCGKYALYQRDTDRQYACVDHALPHDLMKCRVLDGQFTWSDEHPTFGTWTKL